MSLLVQWSGWAVMSLAIATCSGGAKESGMHEDHLNENAARAVGHLTPNDRIGDLLAHPAFRGFAPLLSPWDGRACDEHIYSAAERDAEPDRGRAGLFHFRGKAGAPFAIISPGGGFAYMGSLHEGFPYAVEINRQGYNAFVLRYRAGGGAELATRDLAAAIAFVRRNAKSLDVDPDGYSLWGSSAGARMAAFVGSHGTAHYGAEGDSKPAAVVMAYTGHSDIAGNEPPTFVIVGANDGIAPPSTTERRVAALRKLGARVEYRKVEGVGHGFGLGTGTSAQCWVADA